MITAIEQLNYNCGPVALKFHADITSRAKLLIGPVGTGKTSSASFDLIRCASRRVLKDTRGVRRSRFAVVRNTYPQLKDTTLRTYLDWWPQEVYGRYFAADKRWLIQTEDEDGAREIEILFRALDDAADVASLLSLELTGAHVDEAREIHEDVIKGLLGRVGRYPSKRDYGRDPFIRPPQIVLTTNYPSTRHWLYRDFVSHRIDGYAIYPQDQNENKHNLRAGYYEDLERDYAARPDLLRTMVRGEWGITVKGRAVYTPEEWRRRVHVSMHSLVPDQPSLIVRGWDNTGLSPAVVLTYFTASGQWRIFKEFAFQNTGILEATEAVLQWCARELPPGCKYRDIADPAGRTRDATKQSPADYITRRSMELGHQVRLEDGIQTFKVRRESVATRLGRMIAGEPAVLVDPSCEVLIEGFDGGYSYPEIGTSGEYSTGPAKNAYSHIHDALQYAATIMFGYASGSGTEDEDDLRDRDYGRGRSRSGGY